MKLMQRAIKFHSKKLKAKIFRGWKVYGMNTEVYRNYALRLMKIAFSSFQRYIFRQRIKNIKKAKWQNFLHYNLKQRYFYLLRQGCQKMA